MIIWVVKDIVENNKGVCVFVVVSECIVIFFCVFSEEYFDGLVG